MADYFGGGTRNRILGLGNTGLYKPWVPGGPGGVQAGGPGNMAGTQSLQTGGLQPAATSSQATTAGRPTNTDPDPTLGQGWVVPQADGGSGTTGAPPPTTAGSGWTPPPGYNLENNSGQFGSTWGSTPTNLPPVTPVSGNYGNYSPAGGMNPGIPQAESTGNKYADRLYASQNNASTQRIREMFARYGTPDGNTDTFDARQKAIEERLMNKMNNGTPQQQRQAAGGYTGDDGVFHPVGIASVPMFEGATPGMNQEQLMQVYQQNQAKQAAYNQAKLSDPAVWQPLLLAGKMAPMTKEQQDWYIANAPGGAAYGQQIAQQTAGINWVGGTPGNPFGNPR